MVTYSTCGKKLFLRLVFMTKLLKIGQKTIGLILENIKFPTRKLPTILSHLQKFSPEITSEKHCELVRPATRKTRHFFDQHSVVNDSKIEKYHPLLFSRKFHALQD